MHQGPKPLSKTIYVFIFMDYVNKLELAAMVSDAYFINIGVPEDYRKAQNELVLARD